MAAKAVQDLSDSELKAELVQRYQYQCPPITGTTRRVLERKLEAFRAGQEQISAPGGKKGAAGAKKQPPKRDHSASSSGSQKSSASSKSAGTKVPVGSKPPVTYVQFGQEDNGIEIYDFGDHPTPPTLHTARGSTSKKPTTTGSPVRSRAVDLSPPKKTVPVPPKSSPFTSFNTSSSGGAGAGGKGFSSDSTDKLFSSSGSSSGGGGSAERFTGTTRTSLINFISGGSGGGSAKTAATSSKSTTEKHLFQNLPKPKPTPPKATSAGIGFTSANISSTTNQSFGSAKFDEDENTDDEADDDHMESSRNLSGFSAVRPMPTLSPIKPQQKDRRSSLEKFWDYGRKQWGYLSRPIGQSTPCSDENYRAPVSMYPDLLNLSGGSYITGGGAGKKYAAAGSKYRAAIAPYESGLGGNGARWIFAGLVAFLAVLSVGYATTSHPEAMKNGFVFARDFAKETVNVLYSYAILPVATVLLVVVLGAVSFQLWKWHREQVAEQKRQFYNLVERITEVIQESQPEGGVPEHHVRDMLLPPTKRSPEDYKLWRRAADFINAEDSRVRTEIRLLDGIESSVWIWTGGVGAGGWQGSAVSSAARLRSVTANPPSRCLKLRGLSWADKFFALSPSDERALRADLVEKIAPIRPVHTAFVQNSEGPCVYMALRNKDDAKNAFLALHSNWWNGALVTVKYVTDERYRQRFPSAI